MLARRCMVTRIPGHRWDLARYWHPEMGVPGKYYSYAAGVIDELESFDPGLFGISKREALFMDPQQRLLLELTWRALEDANIPAHSLHGENVAVYVGASSIDNGNLSVEDPAGPGPHFMTGNTLSIVSNRISHIFGLNGPSMTIDTACSSSLVALDAAVKALNAGDVDTAIVAGVNILVHPLPFVGFSQARMLSKDGLCRAYDDDGIGYVRAEGAVVLVLRRSDKAAAEGDRSHATIVATGTNAAGRTNGISLPSREVQADLLRSIYVGNGLDVEQLAFVEGHGTGTKVGDPAEIWSVGQIVGLNRRHPIPIGSIKTNIGHAEPASGLLGVLKAMLALEHDYLPASLHFDTPNDTIDFEGLNVRVASEGVALKRTGTARLAGINSFGFGGANAHIVISDPTGPVGTSDAPVVEEPYFVASAHTADNLRGLLEAYRDRLQAADAMQRSAVIAAAATNRTLLRHRFVVKGGSDEVLTAIDGWLSGGEVHGAEIGEALSREPKVALVFSGNGAQWVGMGLDALRYNRPFRERYQEIATLFSRYSDVDLMEALEAEDLSTRLADTKLAQPLLFAIQAALADAMVADGLKVTASLGHSVGEVAAAYACGALSLEDAVTVIAKRSLHQDVLAGEGTMAAVKLGDQAAQALIRELGLAELEVAAINAPNSVTISGPVEQIQEFRERARQKKVVVQPLDINYPFHHPLIDRARDAFIGDMPAIAPRPSDYAFISTVSGTTLTGESLNPDYWWRNVRQPVKFQQAVEEALTLGCNVFLEMSPRPILTGYVNDIAQQQSAAVSVVSTLTREAVGGDIDPVTRAMSRAIAFGAAVDAKKVFGSRNAAVSLPRLPFDRVVLHPEPTSDAIDIYGRNQPDSYTLLGWRTDPNGTTWKNHIDAHLFPDLAEHVVDNRSILPGAGFIEIAVEAARQFFGTEKVEITNLEIIRPLELSTARILEISTIVSPETGDLQIRSRERLSHDEWAIHVVARVRELTEIEVGARPLPVLGKSTGHVDAPSAYRTAGNFGLDYGPRFQLLDHATLYGDRLIAVDLKAPADAGHPLLTYHLNPLSVDAVFHGLVALFDRFSGTHNGAPYIPVRFGEIRIERLHVPVRRAVIEIERLSATSIKANFHLLDEQGVRIAVLADSRFRRTYLKQHKALDSLSFHYEAVAAPRAFNFPAKALSGPSEPAFKELPESGLGNDTYLFQAAVFSAIQDFFRALAGGRSSVTASDLPVDLGFRRYLSNCLQLLVDAGLAHHDDSVWTLVEDEALPPVADLLRDLYSHCPERGVEIVLINDCHREVLQRIAETGDEADKGREERKYSAFASEATLAHHAVHSPIAKQRTALLVEAVRTFSRARSGHGFNVLELGSVSAHLSRTLAGIVARAGGGLIVCEPDGGARRNLEVQFENDAHVRVISPEQLAAVSGMHLIATASDDFGALLRTEAGLGDALSACDRFVGVFSSPSVFNDFVFGVVDGVSGLQAADAWGKIFEERGFGEVRSRALDVDSGTLVTVEAIRAPAVTTATASEHTQSISALVLHDGSLDVARLGEVASTTGFNLVSLVALEGDLEHDRAAITAALEDGAGALQAVVYIAGAPQAAADTPALLLDRVMGLNALALSIADLRETIFDKVGLRVVVSAPGGAPSTEGFTTSAASPLNTGLWTYLRVLRNEFEILDLNCIDPGAANSGIEAMLSWARKALEMPGTNREWVVGGSDELLEVRAVPGAIAPLARMTDRFEAATIRQQVPSQVSSIRWESCAPPPLRHGEILVKVAATGLNFRDVMWAMGLLPEEALEDGFAGASIGMEFSGEIVAVGSGVDDLVVGDRVMAIAASAFSTHVVVNRNGVAKLPDGVDLVAAASIPVVFLTAYYALVELGRMRSGDTVLIHGAAGGVGLAAIQVAKHVGATIIATAGTPEKRRFAEMLGADHVFDSRSLSFVADVRDVTGGEGVDLVLNSLFGEAMEQSLSLVKPFGRFLELGKRDYYADSKIGLRPFRRNISYFGIDADQLLVLQPDLARRLLSEIGGLFEAGIFSPLPYRPFDYDEIGDAFRLMQNAGHIGKIVVLPPLAGRDHVTQGARRGFHVDPQGMHLVVGGIGGFGLAAADWLVENGARHIALCSRRGLADEATNAAIDRWRRSGVEVGIHACDVTDVQSVEALLSALRAVAPLKTVLHAAMVLDDALISNLTRDRNKPVIDVKARGLAVLDRLTRADPLDHFIAFSSVTTMVGNPGQSNYVAANGYMEGLMRVRRQAGLPGLAIGFGAIADAGYLVRNADVGQLLDRRLGKTALPARDALDLVEQYIMAEPGTIDAAVVLISEFDWALAHNLPVVNEPLFEIVARKVAQNPSSAEGGNVDLVQMIEGKSPAEAQDALFKVIANEIASILRVSPESVNKDSVLKEIGLDSLMAVELGMNFEQNTGFDMPLSSLSDSATVGDVTRRLYEKVSARSGADDAEKEDTADARIMDELSRRHTGGN
ncbi:acyl transferase domain-containing protein/NADPH:quinone reductase-like Zn-dependent oxidoreductase/acyl carrier protein [Rhizobium halophytocola]|uniref:Acyl transferase domain-containing protein/NADPH:quinone reductase-like Zn-dependent oxidoreductase/acyl carrier protein n=2 Tax=Rhizobium halophytocola TaxID=735519 RepID=A0ABS4E2X2_9HYPH|nr:acyl transferase domain-containing protein/NADPH:quinone reductase-like Zn-dependent oxidoreductase/acyl carrier protein [Rhizobium halophytocola]